LLEILKSVFIRRPPAAGRPLAGAAHPASGRPERMLMNSSRIATLDIVRVIGMYLVTILHVPADRQAEATPVIFMFHLFIGMGAVPAFFLLSGYLGARKLEAPDHTFRAWARDRTRSCLVPFLFWNVLVLVFVLLTKGTALASQFRGDDTYYGVDPTFWSVTCALFGIGRTPIVFQFWFLRDLIVASFAAWWLWRYLAKIPLLPWFFFFVPLPMTPPGGHHLQWESGGQAMWWTLLSMAPSVGYYLLGCQLRGVFPPERFPGVRAAGGYAVCWFLIGVGVFAGLIVVPTPLLQLGSAAFILMLSIILAAAPWSRRVAVLGPATFFVYATHEPLQALVFKLWDHLRLPLAASLFCFLTIPLVVFVAMVFVYFGLSRIFPRLMALATGERQSPKPARMAT
jgi:fucose 4-O-acetylase-like acetyltransferase